MKLLSILSFCLLLFSCNKESDSTEPCKIIPPSWLIGYWENDSELYSLAFSIDTDNFIEFNFGVPEDLCDLAKDGTVTVNLNTDKEFGLTIRQSGNGAPSRRDMYFKKFSTNKIGFCPYDNVDCGSYHILYKK